MSHSRVIHLIQDIQTPHNNSLISALRPSGIVVEEWYYQRSKPAAVASPGSVRPPHYIDTWQDSLRFIAAILREKTSRAAFVGYRRLPSQVLLVALTVLRLSLIHI